MKSNLRHPGNTTNISDNNADHVRRGSLGGTDFTDPYGTPVHAQLPGGVVTIVDNSPGGSGGRFSRVTGPDGDSVESLHQHSVTAYRGQRINTEDDVIGVSGASAYNSNYGTGGPHIHNHGVPMRNLEPYYGFLNGGSRPASNGYIPIEEDTLKLDAEDQEFIRKTIVDNLEYQLEKRGEASVHGKLDKILYGLADPKGVIRQLFGQVLGKFGK